MYLHHCCWKTILTPTAQKSLVEINSLFFSICSNLYYSTEPFFDFTVSFQVEAADELKRNKSLSRALSYLVSRLILQQWPHQWLTSHEISISSFSACSFFCPLASSSQLFPRAHWLSSLNYPLEDSTDYLPRFQDLWFVLLRQLKWINEEVKTKEKAIDEEDDYLVVCIRWK